jgi:hypothetical protein
MSVADMTASLLVELDAVSSRKPIADDILCGRTLNLIQVKEQS